MRRPNRIAENLTAAEKHGLATHRRRLTGTADGRNAAAPRRGLTQTQRKADVREAATVLVETMREASQKGDAA